MSGQLVTIVVPDITSLVKACGQDIMWVKIDANMLLLGVKFGTAMQSILELHIRKIQNKTVHIRLAAILKSDHTKCWQVGGKFDTVYA